MFGRLARSVGQGDLVALHSSRGFETVESRVFMRLTVLLCDLVVYIPAVWLFCKSYYSSRIREVETKRFRWSWARRFEGVFLILMQPALLLLATVID